MKKLVLAAVAALSLGTTAMAEPLKIGVAAEPYPPFTSPDAAGNWVGWEVDFMVAICKQAELDCVITPTAWDGIIPALTSGQIDVIMSSMSITAERAKTIDFSDKYYNSPAMIMVAADSASTPDAAGLTGKIVGVKAAGGVRTAKDAIRYLALVNETLGEAWIDPDRFRIGASTLLDDLCLQLRHHQTRKYPSSRDLPLA